MNGPQTALTVQQQGQLVADTGRMQVADVLTHVVAVQEVMKVVMKPDVHYGKIPGTPKPSLYKQGAEVLCLAFRIAPTYRTENLCEPGLIKYRVTCVGIHQATGMMLGEGVGECSSDEEKYRWRKAATAAEWDNAPANMRREKYRKGDRGEYVEKQVRTEPADLANTILKMAAKRSHVAMTLAVTGASSMFSQDLEDLEENLRRHLSGVDDGAGATPAQASKPSAEEVNAAFQKWLAGPAQKAIDKGASANDVIAHARGRGTVLTDDQIAAIRALRKTEGAAPDPAQGQQHTPAPAPARDDDGGPTFGDDSMAPPEGGAA